MNSNNIKKLEKAIEDGFLTMSPVYDSELILRYLKYCLDNNFPRVILFHAGDNAFVSADIRPLKFSKILIDTVSDFELIEAKYGYKPFFQVSVDQGEALAGPLFDLGIYEIEAYNWRTS